jgi:hypothetical protein
MLQQPTSPLEPVSTPPGPRQRFVTCPLVRVFAVELGQCPHFRNALHAIDRTAPDRQRGQAGTRGPASGQCPLSPHSHQACGNEVVAHVRYGTPTSGRWPSDDGLESTDQTLPAMARLTAPPQP